VALASISSPVSRKILDDAAGTRGATPFSLLIGAFDVGRGPEDVELMEKLARLCAAAHHKYLFYRHPWFEPARLPIRPGEVLERSHRNLPRWLRAKVR
jgi:predicted component of type VI protein secretion system